MGSRTFKGRSIYDTSFKFSVIEEYFSSDLSLGNFCKKKSLDRATFRYWLLTFAPEGHLRSKDMGTQKEGNESEEIRELRRQLRQKELDLKKEKMRADFYETMVDVAEEQFNIAIRKKAGTKQ
jgi:transposase-like protein